MTTERGYDTVLVVDFGAQYAQLIARRVREAHVYSEIVPRTMPVAEMLAKEPKAIIFSGGPSSVYAEGAPTIDPAIYDAGVPILGICYGGQLMARDLGGDVVRSPQGFENGGPGGFEGVRLHNTVVGHHIVLRMGRGRREKQTRSCQRWWSRI